MEILLVVVAFIQAHWASFVIAGGALAGVATAVQQKAYWLAAKLALDLVRKVAVEELSGPEKRKKVVEELYKVLPIWAKKSLTQDQLEFAAEKAYQLLRGEIKAIESAKTAEQYVQETTVDPTKGVLIEEELRITAPDNLKAE